ncbi:MAG: Ribosomal RNA small subunit methyltransferase D [Burkholderiaceae bacterium]|nr:Ribosomal RNA small subunit methyltransferase D [Burkholderiaceae bacterium]
MRIVGGAFKRSALPVLDRPGLRPTPQRVRETLFNWLGQDLAGWTCLDAFAGTGALGFEAASRGAAEVVMLEREPALVAALRTAKARLRADAVAIEHADALGWMRRQAQPRFDLVLLDPPFGDKPVLEAAIEAATHLVVEDGFIYIEAAEPLGDGAPGCSPWRQDRAGAVWFHLLRRNSSG